MSRAPHNQTNIDTLSRPQNSSALLACSRTREMLHGTSCLTALNVEFVAKPDEAHNVHVALPAAIDGALGEVAGFAGSFVMIANHEARLVTVVTLWSGESRMQRCSENVRWVKSLLTPYLDRCLRVQTLAAYVPGAAQSSEPFERGWSEVVGEPGGSAEQAVCVA